MLAINKVVLKIMDTILEKIIAGLAVVGITSLVTRLYSRRKFFSKHDYVIKHGDFNQLLTIAKENSGEVKSVKVLANMANLFLPAFQASEWAVFDLQLLLRKPHDNEDSLEKEYAQNLKTMIDDWRKLEEEERIKKLGVKYFDFLTTDWQVIIDDKFIILGLNVPKRDDWKRFKVLYSVLISGDTEAGKLLIEKYSVRFDKFYSEYGEVTNH